MDYLVGFNVITRVLLRERQEGQSKRRQCNYRSRSQKERGKKEERKERDRKDYAAGFEDGGRNGEPSNVVASRSWKRQEGFSPSTPERSQPC